MTRPPDNLIMAPVLLCPADLPGIGRVWLVYERLDDGAVSHVRYLRLLPGLVGEGLEALVTLALTESQECE